MSSSAITALRMISSTGILSRIRRCSREAIDVTLGNLFGAVGRGWEQIAAIMDRASALYRAGKGVAFENISTRNVLVYGTHLRTARMLGRSRR